MYTLPRAISLLLLLSSSYSTAEVPKFTFSDEEFLHRWSEGTHHEFTPQNQEDLDTWTDMVTINRYPDLGSGDGLSTVANNVLGAYKQNGALILRTDSKPKTQQTEAEHFIAAAFPQPNFIEIAFARFTLEQGEAYSIVYSHRIYGTDAGDEASQWLQTNGEKIEIALMAFSMEEAVTPTRKIEASQTQEIETVPSGG